MRGRNCGFIITTLILMGIIVFCTKGIVCGGKMQDAQKKLWYREREERLLADTKEYLANAGFRDSGVTLTRVVDEGAPKVYTFTIHHRRIDCMEERERESLKSRLESLTDGFTGVTLDETCIFEYHFLIF